MRGEQIQREVQRGPTRREAWITGIGILSSLGEGMDAHWEALESGKINIDRAAVAPYLIHPLAPTNFDKQIPRKGDQRQMEPWQRIGTYAAGLALDSAGIKGNPDILGRTDMIVAADGGERDLAVDGAILTGMRQANDKAHFLNERLMNDLRPTLFLAQLPNLLAGNISIVHGVTGSSRTFMGEEPAGVDAVRIALARIEAGQSEIALVGGAQNAERRDVLLIYAFCGLSMHGEFVPVWDRASRPSFALGSMGAFLVLESRDHAVARGARPFARLAAVVNTRAERNIAAVSSTLAVLKERLAPTLRPPSTGVISGATGLPIMTDAERAFLEVHPELVVRATGTHIGHGLEPQFVINIALAALALQRGRLFASHHPFEREMDSALTQVLVTSVGQWRGIGIGLVESVQ